MLSPVYFTLYSNSRATYVCYLILPNSWDPNQTNKTIQLYCSKTCPFYIAKWFFNQVILTSATPYFRPFLSSFTMVAMPQIQWPSSPNLNTRPPLPLPKPSHQQEDSQPSPSTQQQHQYQVFLQIHGEVFYAIIMFFWEMKSGLLFSWSRVRIQQ